LLLKKGFLILHKNLPTTQKNTNFYNESTFTMATVILSTLGAVVGGPILATAGSIVGSYIDNAIFGFGNNKGKTTTSPIAAPEVMTSAYGQTIPVVYGTARVAGNVVWMSTPQVTTLTETQKVRTGKFSSKNVSTVVDRYTTCDLAIAFADAPGLAGVAGSAEASEDEETRFKTRGTTIGLRRLWADGKLIYDARTHNLSIQQTNNFTLAAFYDGGEDQLPDSIIESYVGVGNAPAFRGVCYAVFQGFRLSDFGGRVPNLQAELVATLPRAYTEASPAGIAFLPDGDIAVANQVRRTVSVLDPITLQPRLTIGRDTADYLGSLKAQPLNLAVRSQDGSLWVTNKGDAFVQRLNPVSGAVVATIPLGYYPEDIIMDALGNPWVSFPTRDKVARLDPASNTVAAEYTVVGSPYRLCRGLDGDLWVSVSDSVVRLNPLTGAEKARIAVGLFPAGVACNPVTGHIWVALSGQDVLQIIDPASNTIIKTRNTGTFPVAVSCHPNDTAGSVAVSLLYGNQIKVYSRTFEQMLEYPTVAFPSACAQDQNGKVVVGQAKYDFVLVAEGRE
jgi:DNA-binding beta-propeller fold protein YncE